MPSKFPVMPIRRIIVEHVYVSPAPETEPDPNVTHVLHVPITRAEVEPPALTAAEAKRHERHQARQRIEENGDKKPPFL